MQVPVKSSQEIFATARASKERTPENSFTYLPLIQIPSDFEKWKLRNNRAFPEEGDWEEPEVEVVQHSYMGNGRMFLICPSDSVGIFIGLFDVYRFLLVADRNDSYMFFLKRTHGDLHSFKSTWNDDGPSEIHVYGWRIERIEGTGFFTKSGE